MIKSNRNKMFKEKSTGKTHNFLKTSENDFEIGFFDEEGNTIDVKYYDG